mgnify:FL=1
MSMIIGKSVDVEAYDKDGNKLEDVCRIEQPKIFKKRSKNEVEGDSEKEKKPNKLVSIGKKIGLVVGGAVGVIVLTKALSSKSSNDDSEGFLLIDTANNTSEVVDRVPVETTNVDTVDVTAVE